MSRLEAGCITQLTVLVYYCARAALFCVRVEIKVPLRYLCGNQNPFAVLDVYYVAIIRESPFAVVEIMPRPLKGQHVDTRYHVLHHIQSKPRHIGLVSQRQG